MTREEHLKRNALLMTKAYLDLKTDTEGAAELVRQTESETGILWERLSAGETLTRLMGWRKLTVEDAAVLSGISRSTLIRLRRPSSSRRLRHEEWLGLCLALQLPRGLREDLFVKAGVRVSGTAGERLCDALLDFLYKGTLEDFNRALRFYGLSPVFGDTGERVLRRHRYQRTAAAAKSGEKVELCAGLEYTERKL